MTPDIGRITIALVTYEEGVFIKKENIDVNLCEFENPGVIVAEADLGLVFGDDFNLQCFRDLSKVKITGNKN